PAIVGSSCSRNPGGADGRGESGAVVRVLVAAVMSSAPFLVRHGAGLSASAAPVSRVTLAAGPLSIWRLLAWGVGLWSGGFSGGRPGGGGGGRRRGGGGGRRR